MIDQSCRRIIVSIFTKISCLHLEFLDLFCFFPLFSVSMPPFCLDYDWAITIKLTTTTMTRAAFPHFLFFFFLSRGVFLQFLVARRKKREMTHWKKKSRRTFLCLNILCQIKGWGKYLIYFVHFKTFPVKSGHSMTFSFFSFHFLLLDIEWHEGRVTPHKLK